MKLSSGRASAAAACPGEADVGALGGLQRQAAAITADPLTLSEQIFQMREAGADI